MLLQLIFILYLSTFQLYDCFVTTEQKHFLHLKHNEYRESLSDGDFKGQPKSLKPLPVLIWDVELEKSAQLRALECVYDRQSSDISLQDVGENAYAGEKWNLTMQAWADEAKHYNYPRDACETTCTRYKQIVWETTTHIGCGVAECSMKYENGTFMQYLVICHYKPGGTVNDERPYIDDPFEGEGPNPIIGKRRRRISNSSTLNVNAAHLIFLVLLLH